MKKTLYILVTLFFITFSFSALAKTDIEFIVDVSGSMNKMSGSETQIESAKKALLKTLESTPTDTFLALRAYGHRVEQTDKAKSCEDTELLVPLGQNNKNTIQTKIQNLNPKGYTPIALSLKKARFDFDKTHEANKVIILLSDGEETCGGDPVAVLQELKKEGFEVIVHTIGFNVDAKTRQQLMDISKATGGTYYDANGADELNKALDQATQASLIINKSKATYGKEIRGGDSYESAVAIEKDTEYRLDHHQRKNEFDYFSIELKPAQEIVITLKTLEKGVSLRTNTPKENTNPYAGVQLHNTERNNLNKKDIIGKPHTTETITYTASRAGRYFILIGSTYAALNKDHVTFTYTSSFKGDLDTNADAGNDLKTALTITPKRYEKNYLGGSDTVDYFTFKANAGDEYYIGIIPNDNFKDSYFNITVLNEFKQRIYSKSTGYGEGMKTSPIKLADDGTYQLKITLSGRKSTAGAYTLILKKIEKPTPPPSVPTPTPEPEEEKTNE